MRLCLENQGRAREGNIYLLDFAGQDKVLISTFVMVAWSLACFVPFLKKVAEDVSSEHPPVRWAPKPFTSPRGWQANVRLDAIAADDIIPAVREGVAEAGNQEHWSESIAVLAESAIMDDEEAELILADGLNWKAWAKASPMMRKYAKPVQPDAENLKLALQWLKDGPLGLDQDQLQNAVRNHPKIYLVSPEDKYQKAIAAAPDKYKELAAFRDLLLNDPSVLECYYNCDVADEGCASECGNCWVAYERR